MISLIFEIVKMLTLSSVSVPLILIGGSSQRGIIFMIETLRGQVMSPVFPNSDIIAGIVCGDKTAELVVVQKHDERTLC